MAVLTKGVDFTTGDQVTAANLDNLVDAATFAAGAVDNSTTQLSGGAIIVKDGGITTAKLNSSCVAPDSDELQGGTWAVPGTIGSTTPNSGAFTTMSYTGIPKDGGVVRCTADFTKNTSVALSDATGLSLTVGAGKKYAIDAFLLVDFGNGGVKADFSGTATATSLIAEGLFVANVGLVGQARITGLTSVFVNAIPGAGTQGQVTVRGYIEVNTGGTLTIRFAQSSSSGTDSTLKAGSYLSLRECGN